MGLFDRLLGRTEKAAPPAASSPDERGPWRPIIREAYAGAWQQNVVVDQTATLAFHAVFACLTLIASDISKLRVRLVAQASTGIWSETTNAAFSPVLRKPNAFQTRIQFWESYFLSKLSRGNTYVLKARDGRGVVVGLYVLDPNRCRPLVAPDGSIFYELDADNLAGIGSVVVPAREIIHDRWNCLFHPLVGLSPIYACGLAATQGLRIQENSATFFGNGSRPGGVLTTSSDIKPDQAREWKAQWDENYGGKNQGKIAVLGNGLKYEAMTLTPEDAQLIEQLKWTSEVVCSTYHVPPYKLGIGALPTNGNVQSLNIEYYTQCLQALIEAAELCLDEGLGIGEQFALGTEFDIDGLLRMDSLTQISALKEATGAGIMAPDEARAKIDLAPTEGGSTPYLQQQNYSLAALARRDANDPFAKPAPSAPAPPADAEPANDNAEARAAHLALFEKRVREALNA